MKCRTCQREFKSMDEIAEVNGAGLFHEGDCLNEYIYTYLVNKTCLYKELPEEVKDKYFDDGYFNEYQRLKQPIVIREKKVKGKGISYKLK
ncbi:hypothetical protein AAHH67_15520 [Niallia circulans]